MKKIRLDKYLSSQMQLSRTDVKKMIKNKNVTVNGAQASRPELQVDPETDEICFEGTRIEYRKYIYIMMNKPEGVVSASKDPKEKTVIDLVPDELHRNGLFPAGRLDKDTTGFVLITDDGAFAHEILSPAHHVDKTYIVTLERNVREEEYMQITSGMDMNGEFFRPAQLSLVDDEAHIYRITLTQGRYHQIKRTFGYFGNRVCKLKRIAIGSLSLDPALQPGACRELQAEEVMLLKKKTDQT